MKKKFNNHKIIIEAEVENHDKFTARDIIMKADDKLCFKKEFQLNYNNFLYGISIFSFQKNVDTITERYLQHLNKKYKSQINKYFLHDKNHYIMGELHKIENIITLLNTIDDEDRSNAQIMCIKKDDLTGADIILPILYKIQIAKLHEPMKRQRKYKISCLISENLTEESEKVNSGKLRYSYVTSSSYKSYESAKRKLEEITKVLKDEDEIKSKKEYPFVLFYIENYKKINTILNSE